MRTLLSYLKRTAPSALFLNAPQAVNVVVLVVAMPVILTSIPLSQYGQWQFILALQAWGLVFSAAQMTDGSKRGIANGLDGTFYFALLRRAVLLLLPSIGLLLLGWYFLTTDRGTLASLSFLSTAFMYTNVLLCPSIGEFLIAKRRFRAWATWQVLLSPCLHILTAFTAFLTHSIFAFVLAQVAYAGILGTIVLIRLTTKYRLWHMWRSNAVDRGCLAYAVRFIPIDLVGAVSQKLVDVLIGSLFGFTTLAVFSVANDLRNVMANVFKTIHSMFYADFAKRELMAVVGIIRRHLLPILLLGSFGTAVMAAGATFYILYTLPASLQEAIPILGVLALGLPLVPPIILLHTALNAHFKYKELALANILPSLMKILFVAVAGVTYGVMGMAAAMVGHVLIQFAVYYLVTVRRETIVHLVEKSRLLTAISKSY